VKFRLTPAHIVAGGFALTILLGSFLLSCSVSLRPGVSLSYIDALYMATSAVCVTGLGVVDAGSTFSPLGEAILAFLIQVGGLGVTTVGAGVMLAMGEKVSFRGRSIVQSSLSLRSYGGVIRFLRTLFLFTFVIEGTGAFLAFLDFRQFYPFWDAVGVSIFHSIASFNNAGFDILGTGRSLYAFTDDVSMNILTMMLVFLGGIGFLTMNEIVEKKWHIKSMSLHTLVAVSTGLMLLAGGAVFLKGTESFSWLTAFFYSMSARTAGFATVPLDQFSGAGLMVMLFLMFIGASPGSTGGGIKTTTFFVLVMGIRRAATNQQEEMFHYSVPAGAFRKASVVCLMAMMVIFTSTFILLCLEPHLDFMDALFEMTSAFATVGLSTGVTGTLSTAGKLLSIAVMYIGRLGPLTVATLWYFKDDDRARFPEGYLSIG
jgi:trk system potassium uptake protein TrkH